MERDDEFEYVDMPEGIHLIYQKGTMASSDVDVLVRYWTLKGGKFAESVQQIGKSLGISAGKVPTYISGLSAKVMLNREDLICIHCEHGPELSSRTIYQRYQGYSSRYLDSDGFCRTCSDWHKPLAPDSQWALGHLTRSQLGELVQRYYAQEDCAVLVQEYAINLDPIKFAANISATMARGQCLRCSQSYTFDAMSQVEYEEGHADRSLSCSKCGHEAFIKISRCGTPEDENYGLVYLTVEHTDITGMTPCTCTQCTTERDRDPAIRRPRILQAYAAPNKMVTVNELSLRQIVCLLAMLWSRTSKDTPDIVLAPNIERMHLTPQDRFKWDWIRTLTKSRIIYVDAEKSPLNAFKDDDINTYHMDRVSYLPNVTLNRETHLEPARLLSTLAEAFRKGYWLDSWTEELLPLWKDIAVEECMAYVEERAGHYYLEQPNEDKLRQIFLKLLEDFSVSEIWYMISASYFNAAAFYQSEKCKSLAHATNTVPSKIVSLSEQPRSQIKKWTRIKDIPRCAVTEVLFDIILNVEGDAGFNLSPGRAWSGLLDHHLAHNPNKARRDFMKENLLGSDEALRDLAEEYADLRIDALVEFAITARKLLGRTC